MAAHRRRSTTTYGTFGSVAYAPAYEGNTARAPRREEELRRAPAPRPRERQQVRRHERTKVQVRQAGQVAPFAVVGFLAVALFAAMLVTSYVQLTMANDEMVSLSKELSELQAEHVTLRAQYEKVFDLATIQKAVGETMVRPTSEQVVYIDLSESDTVIVYQENAGPSRLQGFLDGAGNIFDSIIEYFR